MASFPPTIDDLPSPSTNKAGWPWTEGSTKVTAGDVEASSLPTISLVTPTYNRAEFLEGTIRSVLLQGYPNLEYMVMDAGSTDGSQEIIKKYAPWLHHWESEPDRGPPHAINKGLDRATGDWFNWLNSDDYLLPNALRTLAKIAAEVPEAQWISGGRVDINRVGMPCKSRLPWRDNPKTVGLGRAHFLQDATFVRRDFLDRHEIRIPEELTNAFDTVYFYQLLEHEKPLLTTAVFSAMRWHDEQLTANDNEELQKEYEEYVLPHARSVPAVNRILLTLLGTKLNPVVRALVALLTFYGLLPGSRDWTAYEFNSFANTFRTVDARRLVLMRDV